jgi:hypothetical protein
LGLSGNLFSFSGLLCFLLDSCLLVSGFLLSPLSVSISAAYLSFIISSEAIDSAIFGSGDAVMLPSCHLHDIVTLEWIEAMNSGWNAGVEFVAQAKLTVVVQPPGEDLVLVIDVEAVLVTAKNVICVFSANFLYF